MHSFTIWQQDDAEKLSFRFFNLCPPAYSAIFLNNHFRGVFNGTLYHSIYFIAVRSGRARMA